MRGRVRRRWSAVFGSSSAWRAAITGRPGAVGGVAKDALRPALLGLLIDQVLGLQAVLLGGRRHLDRGQERRRAVGGGRMQLEAIEAMLGGLAPVAHLRVVDRQDPA